MAENTSQPVPECKLKNYFTRKGVDEMEPANEKSNFFCSNNLACDSCLSSTNSEQDSCLCSSNEYGQRYFENFYAPYLQHDIERLFINEPECNLNSVWDYSKSNGTEVELDEKKKFLKGIGKNCSSSDCSSDQQISPPLPTSSTPINAMEDILSEANLIEIQRERERIQCLKPKKSKNKSARNKVCVFCCNNGEAEDVYTSHQLKNNKGHITCPVLYMYTCPICGESGNSAHTIKYCPYYDSSEKS